MVFVYNIAIRFYYSIIVLLSPFNKKAKLWLDGRKDWANELESSISPNYPTAWFHCASLGEFEQGRPLIEAYRENHPGHRILLTFFSPSGYEIRKNYSGADYVCYLPLDTPRNAKLFLSIAKPVIAIFVKYEFWYHFIKQLHKNKTPIYVVSAIFRPKQIFFRWYGRWYRKVLYRFNHIFVQNSQSVTLLQSVGISNATVAGDTRFDRVFAAAERAEEIPLLEEFSENSLVIVAGSTWPKDDELLLDYIRTAPKGVKFIIAPHEIDRSKIARFIDATNLPAVRYTGPEGVNIYDTQVLVLDTIGILAAAYRYGDIAYIGGGFGVGIHNTLEPATYGIPIVFGPNHGKFNEAKELIKEGAAFSISNSNELISVFNNLVNNTETRNSAGTAAKEFVLDNIGATDRILGELRPKK
jgi:3-deoxy-D-manno-octulosonic-acid transferase